MPAEIPGFYYDPDKGKYFRLLPHHAAPTAAFYSQSSVRQQRKEEEEDQQQQLEQTARRRKRPTNPYLRATLSRELNGGSGPAQAEDVRCLYARRLRRQALFDLGMHISAFALGPTTQGAGGRGASVIVGTSSGNLAILPVHETDQGELALDRTAICPLVHANSPISSVSVSSRRCVLATFMGDREPPSIYLAMLPSSPSAAAPAGQGVGVHYRFTQAFSTIWVSAAAPSSPAGDMLAGTSAGAVHIVPQPHGVHARLYPVESDIFAVEFLPSSPAALPASTASTAADAAADPHVFLCGARDGCVRLFDVRAPSSATSGSSVASRAEMVLRHGGPVTHLRALGAQHVVVGGLQRVAAYDLRSPHPPSPSSSYAMPTRAVRVYDRAVAPDSSAVGLGFAVDAVRGVLAVADQDRHVSLWSLSSGLRLASVLDGGGGEGAHGRHQWTAPCRALAFDGAVQPGRLWAADGPSLVCFSY